MRKIRFFVAVASCLAFLAIVPAAAFAASPAPELTQPVIMLSTGSNTATLVTLVNSAPAQQQIALANAPIQSAKGQLYLSTADLEQIIGIYGGSASASRDGTAIVLNLGSSSLLAVAGQGWYVQIYGGYVEPIWVGSPYGSVSYMSNGTAYWPVNVFYWLTTPNDFQIQVSGNNSGNAVIYVAPTPKG